MSSSLRHVLLDIEGTTCPVQFVSDVLFPYAAREVSAYLTRHGHEHDIQTLLAELQKSWIQQEDPEACALLQESAIARQSQESESDKQSSSAPKDLTSALLPYIDWLIRRDRKVTAWKDLQGRIWQEGYARGELKADLFPEISRILRRWKELGLELSVYSSGSVAAQQLLYGHSQEGDLRPLFSHWFDTRIGAKQEMSSYQAILEVLGCMPAEVLFISDSTAELAAASAAGLQVIFSNREGNPERDSAGYASIQSLEEIAI